MRFYNTPKREVEEFEPISDKEVTVYTCGPTVYLYQHIGNYTAYIYWDILVRALEANGYNVKRVMNMTDVGHLVSDEDEGEDKMEKGARLSGKLVWEVAEFFGDDFLKNFKALNLREPAKIAKATDYIEAQINLVKELKRKGYTYELEDGIYYDTSKFPRYADFAHLDIEGMKKGARVEFNEGKKNSTDFAVWKFVQEGEQHEMQWEAFGRPGYPGWHLECSSIIRAELGDTIDIHTGGIDHIPVHHTNEIAQSEVVTGKPLANYWLHCNFIMVDGQKISKSLGNVFLFDDLAERGFSHLDFKMWVLEGNYRSERNFTFENLEGAKARLLRWRNVAALRHQGKGGTAEFGAAMDEVREAVADNLNTPVALARVDAAMEGIEKNGAERHDLV